MTKKVVEVTKNSLDTRVRTIAESGKCKGMPNWVCLPQNKEKRLLHIDICKKLAEYSNKNGNYPITYLVYFAVGKNAHRIPTFLGGYDKFNEKKADTIFKWLKMFAKYNGNEKLFRNPNVAHALCKFYDKVSTKTKDFKAAMEAMGSNPKVDVKNAKAVMGGLGIANEPKEEMVLVAAEAAS